MNHMIETTSYEEARKQIDRLKKEGKPVVVQGKSIDFNRKVLENKKVSMLILSHINKKDKMKERDSGLNQVLCNLARENNITLAIDFHELKTENKKEKGKILGRIIQNLKLIKKCRNKLMILNKPKDTRNIKALLRVLGADTKLASESVN